MAQRKLEVVFVGDTRSLDRSFNKVGAGAERNESKLAKMGKALAGAFAVQQVARGAKFAIGAASDLGEQVNKTTVLFGKSSKGILSWSKDSASALGMSRTAALQAASSLGAMFDGLGFGERQAAGMSKQFVTLAADLSSFHDADPTDMLERIRAGLSGEVEPLRKFGVNLSAAAVTSKALAMGLEDSSGALTEQDKVLARSAIMMAQTAKAQGDRARTSGSLANQQRELSATTTDLAAKLGSALLPAATAVAGVVLGLAGAFGSLPGPIQTTIGVVAGLAVGGAALGMVLGPLGTTMGVVGTASTFMAGKFAASAVGVRLASIVMRTSLLAAFGVIGVAIAAAIAAAVLLYKNWDTVVAGLGAAWDWMKGAAGDAFEWVKGAVTDSWNAIKSVTSAVWSAISSALSTVWNAIRSTVSTVWSAIRSTIESVWSAIRSATSAVWNAIRAALSAVWDSIRAAMSLAWNALVGVAEAGWNAIRATTGAIWAAIRAALSTVWGAIRSAASTAWGAVRSAVVDPVRSAVEFVTDRVGDLRTFLDKAWKTIVSGVDKIKGPFVSAFERIGNTIEKVVGWLGKVVDGVKEAVSFLGKLKLPKINLPDLNPFGGSGNGTTVGPPKGRPASVDGFNGLAASFGNVVTSGYRPGDDGWHGRNRARDYAGGNMMGFARAMMAYAPNLLELIHTPLGVGVKNGQVVPMSFFGGSVMADHRDHVHVAMAQGGVATGGYVRVGELGPETVQLPAGSRVTQASESTGTAPGVMVNIERLVNEADPREIAREIAWQIGH